MRLFASLLQATGIAATFWAVYAIAGLWLFLLVAGAFTLLVGLALERTTRTTTTMR